MQEYFYDNQLRRYWLQFCRIFTGWQYETGIGAQGQKMLSTIPVSLGTKNRQVGIILRNNSENTILSVPRITCEMIDIQASAERRQTPNHVSTINVFERAVDPLTNKYTGELGNTYTVERIMPVPYDMTMRMNLWTSNELQKHQIMEQIMQIFNPSIDLQTGDSPLDWTSLTIVELDSIVWTNRDLPVGADDDVEISSMTFKMPIWINPPAKIKKQNIIRQIITNISTLENNEVGESSEYAFSPSDLYSRVIVTPGNHQASVGVETNAQGQKQSIITLLTAGGAEHENGKVLSWRELLGSYGQYRAGVSQFRLKTNNDMDDHETDIIGIFDFHPTEVNKLVWSPDSATMKANNLPAIDAILDCVNDAGDLTRWPGDGLLPAAEENQRYLLASDLPIDSRWTGVHASVNDIVEFIDGKWVVVFDASTVLLEHFLVNRRSSKQLRWTGEMWVDAISGDYRPGFWRVFL
jgi:hypothetical protein